MFKCTILVEKRDDDFYLTKISKREKDENQIWYLFEENDQHSSLHKETFAIDKVQKMMKIIVKKRK